MDRKRVGPGSTWDADYAWTWDDPAWRVEWDGGTVVARAGRAWVVVTK